MESSSMSDPALHGALDDLLGAGRRRQFVARREAAQHMDQLIDKGDEENRKAAAVAELRNPQRDRDDALRNVVKLQGLPGHHGGVPGKEADEADADEEGGDLNVVADLAAEAIRLTRQLAAVIKNAEVAGLLALMLLHHARRMARTRPDGSLVPLAEQDRSLWDTRLIAEGVDGLQAALSRDRLGEFQAQAAIAALHADAQTVEETDWQQIVEWYDELVRLTDSPVARLNRAVAVGEADGARAGLAALAELDPSLPRYVAVSAYLHERDGDPATAAALYAQASRSAANVPGRDHLTRQAARLNAQLRSASS